MSDDPAMLRAVEILAQIHDRVRNTPNKPTPSLKTPVVLRSDRITFELRKTLRPHVERELGTAFSYPAHGWHTYATKETGKDCLLSAFYKDDALIAVELYVPRTGSTPSLAARDLGGFRLDPGGIPIGASAEAITQFFTPAVGGLGNLVYDRAFEARFAGGIAYAMARNGVIERLAMYAHLVTSTA